MGGGTGEGGNCNRCSCNCYYCHRGHNAGVDTCVFGHASYCSTRKPRPVPVEYEPKHMKVE